MYKGRVRPMAAGRLGADKHRSPDLAVGPALVEQPEHLCLTRGQSRRCRRGGMPRGQVDVAGGPADIHKIRSLR